VNPLIPTAWDITLAVVALVSVLRSRVGRRAAVLWALFVVTLPVVGAVAWFVVRRRARRGMIRPTLSA